MVIINQGVLKMEILSQLSRFLKDFTSSTWFHQII